MPDLRTKILELVNHANYQPVKPAVIAKKLGVAGEAVSELKKIDQATRQGGPIGLGTEPLGFRRPKEDFAARRN